MDNVQTFGQLLKDCRNKLGKNVCQVAEKIFVTESIVSRWEAGISFPDECRLPILSNVYRVSRKKLKEALKISKEARLKEKDLRKSLKVDTRKKNAKLFPGEIKVDIEEEISKSVLRRHN